ncbi:MAG TPA: hypothetical protein VF390_00890 [Patescibacteria group bacterium]
MIRINKKIKNPAFTLVEAMVFLFIFSVITVTFYSVITLGTGYIIEAKNRLGALALANEKMEIVRNLQYGVIGTTTGIPAGNILADEDAAVGAKTFHVKTLIQYIDDPFDGVLPADPIPTDYKRVKITISWQNSKGGSGEVYLVSRFVPPGLEVSSGDGILAVNIADGTGASISQAHVRIVNNIVSPTVDISQNTDDQGNLMFPGAKQSQLGYEITVSKNGYETVSTVDPGSVAYTPKDPHASVVSGSLNTTYITIDKLADLKIKSVDYLGNALPDVDFHIKGSRELGTNSTLVPAETVYILDADATTNASGEKDFNNYSPGQFFLTNVTAISGYTLIGASPISSFEVSPAVYKFSLLPDEAKTVELKFANNSADALLVKVLNNSDNAPLNNIQVKLTNGNGYDTTVTTSFDGVAFFPVNSDPFLPGMYTLEISDFSFQNYSETVDVNKLTNKEVKLIPN